ncbi:hypothetical protein F4775DRAFT_470316 [Biscogniauxia sp. FL1348]|nr:hypothetical protein F4775DRAFT_470316 [Biscogniauxia sp. FL1348]
MTRNNLSDHLTWLLANIALFTPNAPVLPPTRAQSEASFPDDATVFFTPPSEAHTNVETRTHDPFASPPYPDLANSAHGSTKPAARPTEARDRGASREDTMGRLVSKAGSNRPNLILRQEQLLTPTSTTGSTSLGTQYDAFLKKNSAKTQTSPPRHQLSNAPSGNLFLTPGASIPSGRTFETIDLTNDSAQTSPNTTAFGSTTQLWREDFAMRPEPPPTTENSSIFGTDVMVWQEDYASRPVPLPTEENSTVFGSDVIVWDEDSAARPQPMSALRGKKRKSDFISQPPPMKIAHDEFPDIYELLSDDEALNIRPKRSPTKSPVKRKLKLSSSQSPSKTTLERGEEIVYQTTTETSVSTNLSPVAGRGIKPSPLKTPRKGVPPSVPRTTEKKLDPAPEDDPESPVQRRTQRARSAKRDERVIQDSDEDELLAPESPVTQPGGHDRPSVLKPESDEEEIFAYNTPSKMRAPTPSGKPSPLKSARKHDRNTQSQGRTSGDTYQDPDLSFSQDLQPASQPDVSVSDEEMSAILQLFLDRPSAIETQRALLQESLLHNRNAYKKSLEEGNMGPRGRLRREKERLMQQQKGLDALSSEFRSYEELKTKRDALIARIDDAYSHNLDTEEDEARLEELEILVKDRQSLLKTMLPTAGINNRGIFENKAGDGSTNPIEPVVQATQISQPAVPPSWSRDSSFPHVGGGTQVIFQTQIPSRLDPVEEVTELSVDETPIPKSGKQRRRISSPPQHDQEPDQRLASAPRSELAKTPMRQKPATPFIHDIFDENDDEDPFEDRPPPTSRRTLKKSVEVPHSASGKTRKSPSKGSASRHQGYQSDYSDDIDISELAQEFELQQSSSENRPSRSSRSALSETSGNAGLRKQPSIIQRASSSSTVATVSPEQKNRPWYRDVRKALKDRFRMSGFRHNQLEAINATLAGNDAFILMPTGGGKSLCYQLPAVITSGKTSGVTVVVSPLISLMQDQVDHLKALNIQAATFNGESTPEQRSLIMDKLKNRYPENWIQLLYVTPEMINKSKHFLNGLDTLYQNKKLARLVIDEAHCVSQWGHDFRPDYKELGSFRERFPRVPLMALTATATQNVIMDVKHNLGIEECDEFTQSFNRPNLYYEVLKKEKDNITTIANLINSKYTGLTGIVYTLSRKSAENIAGKLRDQGIAAHHYHANIESEEKARIQKDWQRGKIKVVVATIAFGMGIDKPDVRFVIHQSIPKSLEGYYQETGRAGRDGKPSECYLYFSYGDVTSLRKMISEGDGSEEQKERQRNMLGTVTAFCDNQSDCRRVEILRYFGEVFTKEQCNATCDNCKSQGVFEQKDFTKYALAALEVIRLQDKLTLNQCTEYLLGKKKKTEFDERAERFHGIAKGMPKHEIHRIIDRLVMEDALKEDNIINRKIGIAVQYFKIGRKAHSFLSNRRQLFLTTRVKGSSSQDGPSGMSRRLSKPAAPATRREPSKQHPPSTNVSSPVRARVRKDKGKGLATINDEDSEDDYVRHKNGYAHDGFVVGDDDSDDGFETMPLSKRPRRRQQELVGPPISHDARMSDMGLSDLHKDIVQSFFEEAKELEERVRTSKRLRQPIFSQAQLREMGLRWTVSLDQMQMIPGIDGEKVKRYGDKLLPLIQQYHRQYQEIMGVGPETGTGASVAQDHSIVDLVSTDEDEDMDNIYDDDDEEGEASGYFGAPTSEAQSFLQQLEQAGHHKQPATSRGRSGSAAPRSRGASNWRGGGKRSFARRTSGGSSKGKYAGVKKKGAAAGGASRKSASSRPATGSSSTLGQTRLTSTASKSKSQGGGFSGIGLMEH